MAEQTNNQEAKQQTTQKSSKSNIADQIKDLPKSTQNKINNAMQELQKCEATLAKESDNNLYKAKPISQEKQKEKNSIAKG